jgi:hypothetical protein
MPSAVALPHVAAAKAFVVIMINRNPQEQKLDAWRFETQSYGCRKLGGKIGFFGH